MCFIASFACYGSYLHFFLTCWVRGKCFSFKFFAQSCILMVFLFLQDAFVLCKVTQRIDWTSENGNQAGNSNPHPQQSNAAAISAVSVEQPDTGAEQPSDVASVVITANTETPDGEEGLQQWLEELIDPSFDPSFTTVVDSVSAEPSLDEQNAESSVCSYPSQYCTD